MSGKFLAVFFFGLVLACFSAACGGAASSSGAGPVYDLDFVGGLKHENADRPDPIPDPAAPRLTDTGYYPITRQGGKLTGVLTFQDDEFSGVTTLILQVEGSAHYFTFSVSPLEDPLNPGLTTINFSVELSRRFRPGIYTLYMGLGDEDGHVSGYAACLLVVKSLKDLQIAELLPRNGEEAGANVQIQARFSQQIFPGEAEITLRRNGESVAGAMRFSPNGRTLTFYPDELLAPGAEYVATAMILVNGHSLTSRFTTVNPPPLPDSSALTGRTFGFILARDNVVEPEEGKVIFDFLMGGLPPILTKILSLENGRTMAVLGAVAQQNGDTGWVQAPLVPAFGPDPGELFNPWFKTGPAEFLIPLAPLGLPGAIGLHELRLSGCFTSLAGAPVGFQKGVLTGRIDSREINVVLEQLMGNPFELCGLLPLCDEEGFVIVRAENLSGFVVTGLEALYGIKCETDVNTVNGEDGGSLRITCITQRDAQGFPGNDLTFFAKTGTLGNEREVGTWDFLAADCAGAPPVCHVPASGEVSVQLNLAAGELVPGDPSFRVGASYPAPPGTMTASRAVSVQ